MSLTGFLGWHGWQGIASLLTSFAAIAALVFTGLSLRATHDQYGLSEQGQLADRFSKAIEQLGSNTIDVRLGSIYSLEDVARDSPTHHSTVFEVLNAFVRTRSHNPPCYSPMLGTRYGSALPADVQAALTVTGRRDTSHDGPNPPDLRTTCLAGADLVAAQLDRANLTGANLNNSNLTGAHLHEAHLFSDVLMGAELSGAHLTAAELVLTDLTGARLTGADLTGAKLNGADLTAANLTGANLFAADLTNICYTSSTRWPTAFAPPASRTEGCPANGK